MHAAQHRLLAMEAFFATVVCNWRSNAFGAAAHAGLLCPASTLLHGLFYARPCSLSVHDTCSMSDATILYGVGQACHRLVGCLQHASLCWSRDRRWKDEEDVGSMSSRVALLTHPHGCLTYVPCCACVCAVSDYPTPKTQTTRQPCLPTKRTVGQSRPR